MNDEKIFSVREALMAELLRDVDSLANRLEDIDKTISAKIEKSVTDAAGQAFLSAKFNLEKVINEQMHQLTSTGTHSAALINKQLTTGITQFIVVNESIKKKIWRLVFIQMGIALIAGLVGGVIGASFFKLL